MTDIDPRDPVDDFVDVAAGVDVWERRFRPGATLHVLGVSGETDSIGQVSGDARAVSPTADTAPGSPSFTPEHLARRYWAHHERMAWQFGYQPVGSWEELPDARRRFLVQVFAAVLEEMA